MATPPRRQTPCRSCPLKQHRIFRTVTPEEVAFIERFKSGEFVTDPGATIIAEGRNSSHLYTVLSGWAFRHKMLPDGRRQILNFLLPGDFIGLQGTTMAVSQHSVEALTQMVLCVFDRDKLWTLYQNHPSLAYDLTWLAARGERIVDENLLNVGRRSAKERIAYFLLDIFLRARRVGLVEGRRLPLPFTQQHLADALGMSLVHTNKTLQLLVSQKLLRWRGGMLEVLNEDTLADEAGYDCTAQDGSRPLI